MGTRHDGQESGWKWESWLGSTFSEGLESSPCWLCGLQNHVDGVDELLVSLVFFMDRLEGLAAEFI